MNTISSIAKKHNISVNEVWDEMMTAILAAKDEPGFQAVFGKGVIPSPEEFIRVVASKVESRE